MARLGDELFVVLAAGENGLFSFSAAMSGRDYPPPLLKKLRAPDRTWTKCQARHNPYSLLSLCLFRFYYLGWGRLGGEIMGRSGTESSETNPCAPAFWRQPTLDQNEALLFLHSTI